MHAARTAVRPRLGAVLGLALALLTGHAAQSDLVYVAGAATDATAGNRTPSYVRAYDIKTGALVREYAIRGEDLSAPHANSCIAFDGRGRLSSGWPGCGCATGDGPPRPESFSGDRCHV